MVKGEKLLNSETGLCWKVKLYSQKAFLSIPSRSLSSCVAHLEFGGWRYRGHKSHCYWCGYEPRPNGDDSARSFSSAFPLQRWALDTLHLTCHFPALRWPICSEPIRTRRTFNFICSSTLQGFFPLEWPLSSTLRLTVMHDMSFWAPPLCFLSCDDCSLCFPSLGGSSARVCSSAKPTPLVPDLHLSLKAATRCVWRAIKGKHQNVHEADDTVDCNVYKKVHN